MSTRFAPSTVAELAARLERRRTDSARLALRLHADADLALEDLDLSDLLDNENPDAGTNDEDRLRSLQLATLIARTVDAADDALDRLAAGTYGICERCRAPIPLARLRAVPETKLCVTCKASEGRVMALAG